MRKLLVMSFLLICCSKEEYEIIYFDESTLLGTWEATSVELIKATGNIDLSVKLDDCTDKEHIIIDTLDTAVWISYFPWLNEPSPFCHKRAESLSFRLINKQILVEEFNDETVLAGEVIDEVTLQLYLYHKTAQDTKLLFEFTKLKP